MFQTEKVASNTALLQLMDTLFKEDPEGLYPSLRAVIEIAGLSFSQRELLSQACDLWSQRVLKKKPEEAEGI